MMSKMLLASSLAFVATTAELTEYGRQHGLKEFSVTQGATCVDQGIPVQWHRYVPDCATAKARGNCNRPGYIPYSKAYCAKTCGYCESVCEDHEIPKEFQNLVGPNCASAQKQGNCEKYAQHAKAYCPKTCGLCPGDEALSTDDFDAEGFEAEDFMDTLNEFANIVGQADPDCSSKDCGEFMDLLADVADQLEFPENYEDSTSSSNSMEDAEWLESSEWYDSSSNMEDSTNEEEADFLEWMSEYENASAEEDADFDEFVDLLAKIASDLDTPTEGQVSFEEELPLPGDSTESDEEIVPFFTDFMDQISDLADQLSEMETPELEMLANLVQRDPEDVPINPKDNPKEEELDAPFEARRGEGQCSKCPEVRCHEGRSVCVANRKPRWSHHYPCVCQYRNRSCPRDHERC